MGRPRDCSAVIIGSEDENVRGYKTLTSFMEFLKAGLGPRYSGHRRTEDARKGEGIGEGRDSPE